MDQRHQTHRNILYSLVVILMFFQIISFVALTLKISQLETNLRTTRENLTDSFSKSLANYDLQNQRNFNDLSKAVTKQQANIEQEINLIKANQEDFSGVIDISVKSVVSVMTNEAVGTGFIVHSDVFSSLIVTNEHVIDDATNIYVVTHDKKEIPAVLVGSDKLRDVAVLEIKGDYQALEVADSNDLQVGNKVIAIGNPLGLSFSVTEGIISALNRKGPNGLDEYIQTDVSLNPGNSGGPLIDTSGHVIGVNNFKVGNAESLGFALESNRLKEVVNDIMNKTIIA
ncbi:trypsin-like peptidase domain-containing protein [Candidatus Pacearchaeota archaeon]|nr:trypsin-like peptidase domain-containing protein [Candidatus Pacearchaeota archaeon]